MAININDGTRASHLTLDRRATGELEGEVPQAHRDVLAAAKARVAPFDFEILRAASHRVAQENAAQRVAAPAPARRWWSLLLPVLAAVTTMLLVIQIGIPDDPIPDDGHRIRGGALLDTFVMQDGVGQPWEPGTVLAEGDFVQFAYSAESQGDTMVLLSIDGEGTLTVFWPAEGDTPEPVHPSGKGLLEDSIELDGAMGPEAFVVFFGIDSVEEVSRLAEDIYETGGPLGLTRLAQQDPTVDVVIIEKE
ncbi:MAG: hypothetical protein ACI8RZ_005814 [Myxococcota bacterium]|jgi:hypothetical protein